ncbi:MAG: hypothetical protein ACW98K_11830 [Candidatus Kariarchaeaceae archaeon]
MKYLEHRRHSIRHKPGIHLNRDGVKLARKVGESMGDFDYVVTSTIERAWETALVMGYAVDEMRPELIVFGEDVNKELMMETTFSGLKSKYTEKKVIRDYTDFQLHFIKQILNKIEDEQSLLLVSHGLIIDLPLFVMFPQDDPTKWGSIFSYCEGYKVRYDGEKYLDLELMRIS